MLSPITSLADYVSALGKAYVYITTDPTTAAAWSLLGLTEGEIQVEEKFQMNDYKLPEWTGEAVHARNIDGQSLTVTVPLIWGDATLYDKVAPTGQKGGGRSTPIAVNTYTVLLIPQVEVDAGISLTSTVWDPAAPSHAIWIHKASFEPGTYAFKHGDGGKVIRPVTITAMFNDNMPEGQKLYTIGDPVDQGISTYQV